MLDLSLVRTQHLAFEFGGSTGTRTQTARLKRPIRYQLRHTPIVSLLRNRAVCYDSLLVEVKQSSDRSHISVRDRLNRCYCINRSARCWLFKFHQPLSLRQFCGILHFDPIVNICSHQTCSFCLVDTPGVEPDLPLCKRGAFPIKLAAHCLVEV